MLNPGMLSGIASLASHAQTVVHMGSLQQCPHMCPSPPCRSPAPLCRFAMCMAGIFAAASPVALLAQHMNSSQQFPTVAPALKARTHLCTIRQVVNAILHALQITSLFLHWFPACVAYTERWHPDVHVREHNKKAGTAAMEEWHNASLWDLVVLPMAPYLLWALLYYLKVGASRADLKYCRTGSRCRVGCRAQ